MKRLIIAAGFLCLASMAAADHLSTPPANPWDLQSVADADISGAEPFAQSAIRGARRQVVDLLESGNADAAQLAEAYGRLGAYYHVYTVRTAAESCYANAVHLDPSVFRWVFLLGYLAHESGRNEAALERFAAARRIDPDYATLDLLEGEALLGLNRAEEAEPLLRRAMAHDDLKAAAAFRLGQIVLQRREYAAATELFKTSLAADPQADSVYFPLAQALRGLGENTAARDALGKRGTTRPHFVDTIVQELESLDEGARPFYLAGLVSVRHGDYVEAASAFGKGLALDPENPAARTSYARALYLSGDVAAARVELEAVERAVPEEPLPIFLLALLDDASGDSEVSRRRMERVLSLSPDHSGALYFLGLRDFEEGRYDLARQRLIMSVELEPGNTFAQLLALVARHRMGEDADALIADLSVLADADAGHWVPRYALARLLAAGSGDAREVQHAVSLAESLVNEQPSPPAYEALALAQAASGDYQAAENALEDAKTFYLFGGQFTEVDRLDGRIERVRSGHLPDVAWREDDPFLNPPVISPRGPFKEYPSARAY
ncbi:MAG: tetratricopeptide repeat protein [Pseudomonadota bacterium]